MCVDMVIATWPGKLEEAVLHNAQIQYYILDRCVQCLSRYDRFIIRVKKRQENNERLEYRQDFHSTHKTFISDTNYHQCMVKTTQHDITIEPVGNLDHRCLCTIDVLFCNWSNGCHSTSRCGPRSPRYCSMHKREQIQYAQLITSYVASTHIHTNLHCRVQPHDLHWGVLPSNLHCRTQPFLVSFVQFKNPKAELSVQSWDTFARHVEAVINSSSHPRCTGITQ